MGIWCPFYASLLEISQWFPLYWRLGWYADSGGILPMAEFIMISHIYFHHPSKTRNFKQEPRNFKVAKNKIHLFFQKLFKKYFLPICGFARQLLRWKKLRALADPLKMIKMCVKIHHPSIWEPSFKSELIWDVFFNLEMRIVFLRCG